MANLNVRDKTGLGMYVRRAATNDQERQNLLAHKDNANDIFKEMVDIPNGHTIKVIEEGANTTTLVLPSKDDFPPSDQVWADFTYPPDDQPVAAPGSSASA